MIGWFRENRRDLPWRRTRDPYAIWVSEIMLQQTQVKTVIPYWERWMRELPTIASVAKAKPDRVLKLWEGLGYYSRARNLQKAAQMIVAEHAGIFPSDFEKLLELPGIGRYTAGAIGSIAFALPTPIVDGNVARVFARYLGIRGDLKSRETTQLLWQTAECVVKAAKEFDASGAVNESLMELGATVCLPKQPRCELCPVRAKCFAWKNGLTAVLPQAAVRPVAQQRTFRALLIRRGNRIWMRRRPAGVVNAGFWELPNVEAYTEAPPETLAVFGKAEPSAIKKVCDVKHTITRFRMTLEVYESRRTSVACCKSLKISVLQTVPIVNAHRKALAKLGLIDGIKQKTAKHLIE